MVTIMKLEMNLLDNSHDFLNESLYYAKKADCSYEVGSWKMAIINIVQAMELMLKECLRKVHPILIHENIDKISYNNIKTVSLSLALERIINILKINLSENEKRDINMAIRLRNEMTHYQFTLTHEVAKTKYVMLFKFLSSFHQKYLDGTLHNNIKQDLWGIENDILRFAEDFIFYNGVEVTREYVGELEKCQNIKFYTIDGVAYERIKFGKEHLYNKETLAEVNSNVTYEVCSDCSVKTGQYHVLGCDIEICPKCKKQVILCECDIDEIEQYEQWE